VRTSKIYHCVIGSDPHKEIIHQFYSIQSAARVQEKYMNTGTRAQRTSRNIVYNYI